MRRCSLGKAAIPAHLGRGLGQAGSGTFLEGPHPHPGGIKDGLVEDLSANLALPDLVPVQELDFHVALGAQSPTSTR